MLKRILIMLVLSINLKIKEIINLFNDKKKFTAERIEFIDKKLHNYSGKRFNHINYIVLKIETYGLTGGNIGT